MIRVLQGLFLCLVIVLAGCATQPAAPNGHAEHQAEAWIVKAQQSLVAGDMSKAAQQYYKAAAKSTQPQVAAQATVLAWRAGRLDLMKKAAQRWQTLKPGATGPHHFLAVLALRRHDLDAATKQLRTLLDTGEADYSFSGITDMLVVVASPYEALMVMQRLAAHYPDSPEARYALARTAVRADHTRLARQEVGKALAAKPHWLKALLLNGRLLIHAGQPQAALAPVRALLHAQPNNAAVKMGYVNLLFVANDIPEARKILKGMLADNPQAHPQALLLLALDRLSHNDEEGASRYLTLLLESGKKSAEAYFYLGKLAARKKDYRMALDWLGRIDPKYRTSSDDLAVALILARMDKLHAARRFLQNARAQTPQRASTLAVGEAHLLAGLGHGEAALDLLNHSLKTRPHNTELLYARSMLAADMGYNKLALADARQIVHLEPKNTAALNALGYMMTVNTHDYQQARNYIEKALGYSPHNAAIIDSLGWVEYHLGDLQEAVKVLQRAHDLDKDPQISAHLITVLRKSGQRKQAQRVLKQALKTHPDAKSLKQLVSDS